MIRIGDYYFDAALRERLEIESEITEHPVESGAATSTLYTPITENLLTFYSLTIQTYEICVITKLCYETILGLEP